MKLGIDFGTTRIVIAAVDRGNYPIVTFDGPENTTYDWYPPLIAVNGQERRYGWEAWAMQAEPGWTVVRSVKRLLENAGPGSELEIAGYVYPLPQLLGELTTSLRLAIQERSNLQPAAGEPLEAMIGVPANANGNQRFLTTEAFRNGGFAVLGLLNEPSAASIEFGHKQRASSAAAGALLVYDFGGGTFDASLVELDSKTHSVLANDGIPTLGGDDFDAVLAELALEAAGVSQADRDLLPAAGLFRLHEECRARKEGLNPNSRRLTIDLTQIQESWPAVTVSVADFYTRCSPLVQETLHTLQDLLAARGYREDGSAVDETQLKLEAVYVTGGASELPLVSRLLREQFGRRVKRSAHSRSASAIGLAIQADAQAGYVLREKFNRTFGVWREAEGGRQVRFDPLFPKGTDLPGPGEPPIVHQRTYAPVHNVGHFRYLECSAVASDGEPQGDLMLWDEVRFPFDPALQGQSDLSGTRVEYEPRCEGSVIEEQYSCDASGTVMVTILNLTEGYDRAYRLGRWAEAAPVVKPSAKRRAAKPARA